MYMYIFPSIYVYIYISRFLVLKLDRNGLADSPTISCTCMRHERGQGLCEPPPALLTNMASAQKGGCIFVRGGIMMEGLVP